MQAYPLDLVRTRLSAQTKSQYYTGIAHALRTIARDEGMFGLYRGLGATLLQVTPSLAINYTAYGTLRSHWLELYGQESNTVSLLEMFASCRGSGARAGTLVLCMSQQSNMSIRVRLEVSLQQKATTDTGHSA